MAQRNLLARILKWLHPLTKAVFGSYRRTPKGDDLVKLMNMLEQTDEVEITCDEVLALLDQYVEMEMRGEDVAHLMPLLKRHLETCQDCREEYEALKRILGSSAAA